MKITLEMDCTPAEARAFFGLPDIAPIQEALINSVQNKISGTIETMDAETIINSWVPMGIEGLSQLQKIVMGAMMNTVNTVGSAVSSKTPASGTGK